MHSQRNVQRYPEVEANAERLGGSSGPSLHCMGWFWRQFLHSCDASCVPIGATEQGVTEQGGTGQTATEQGAPLHRVMRRATPRWLSRPWAQQG
jgi:hypothetical protein